MIDALDEELGPHFFPETPTAATRASARSCGNGRLGPEARQVRRLHRLLELSGMPLHAQARARGDGDGARRRRSGPRAARPRSGEREAPSAAQGPLRQLCPARRDGGTATSRSAPRCRRAWRLPTSRSKWRLALLALPREVGLHPEDGEPIVAGIGRFGPYVRHGKTYKSLTAGDDVLDGRHQPRGEPLAEPKTGARPRRARSASSERIPRTQARSSSYKGRYGPYVSHGGVNATVPATSAGRADA